MTIVLLCAVAQGAWAETSNKYYECSLDGTAVVKTEKDIPASATDFSTVTLEDGIVRLRDTWSVVTQNHWFRDRIYILGETHIILCDGVTITMEKGLMVCSDGDNAALHIHSQSYGDNMGKLVVNQSNNSYAAIGCERGRTTGPITIHGGNITASGENYGAGIGGGEDSNSGNITIFDGKVTATGGDYAAGIGGGYAGSGDRITIYGGTVTATGGKHGAGIGCGEYFGGGGYGGIVTIYGGMITAQGGMHSAGIGGGADSNGADVTVNGGTVKAKGGEYGPGIGNGFDDRKYSTSNRYTGTYIQRGGYVETNGGRYAAGIGGAAGRSQTGDITIYDGNLYAQTGGWDGEEYTYGAGAGIGSGGNGWGGNVYIYGGHVMANGVHKQNHEFTAGALNETKAAAIGGAGIGRYDITPTDYADHLRSGNIVFGDVKVVSVHNHTYGYYERKDVCNWPDVLLVEPCEVHAFTLAVATATDHIHVCTYCGKTKAEVHNQDGADGKCSVCSYQGNLGAIAWTVTPMTPMTDANNDYVDGYEGSGEAVIKGQKYILPTCDVIVNGYTFKGWVAASTSNGLVADDGATFIATGTEVTPSGHIHYTAHYEPLTISLADNADNSYTIRQYNGRKTASVTLAGRTLYKDGKWNTLCLPFSVTLASGPLSGDNPVAKVFDNTTSGFSNGTLTINFSDAPATIPAGTPFIIKWDNTGVNLTETDLVFNSVTIDATTRDVVCNLGNERSIAFCGTYNATSFTEADHSILFLGDNNTLYHPQPSGSNISTIGAQRAYFVLDGLTAGDKALSRIFLNFGDDETTGVHDVRCKMEDGRSDAWYSLDGRKIVNGKLPKGIYINNGRKVVIK